MLNKLVESNSVAGSPAKRILIGCECSGVIREAFARKGFDAWSCDLKPSEQPGQHLKCRLEDALSDRWNLAIFHPPCTYLCNAGASWWKSQPHRLQLRQLAFDFFKFCYNAPVEHICVENSLSFWLNSNFKKPTQTIHPFHFGEPYKKATCLWLKNLPPLQPTNILPPGKRYPYSYMMPGTKNQSTNRARTFTGIAEAMSEQWSKIL